MTELVLDTIDVQYDGFAAVRGASVSVAGGRTLALVGESGSGKSSLALAAARLLPPGTDVTGSIRVGDRELSGLRGEALRAARGRIVGYLAQDAMAALNPVMRVGKQVAEVFVRHEQASSKEAHRSAVDLLRRVGIQGPEIVARKYPHELSGGMRQRVMIAIALALAPEVLIADEPTTALDVTVQAEILALVRELQAERNLVVVWITHDMGVVAEIADEVAVMYGGRIVEQGPVAEVFARPLHPYTNALIGSAREEADTPPKSPFVTIAGQPPTGEAPPGCPFHPRCPIAVARCSTDVPAIRELGVGHTVACHLAG
ncbi:MAG: peptide/nickel transport system ATP-binding protein [Gaiellaceae bacterium]|nr:peptide/nickel transport system ATP-binding protein [Gaiellaceae bacterium]